MAQLDYGKMPIKKLILRLAIPNIVTMLVMSVNMVIDGFFMGNYMGSDALAAVNLVTPFMMIVFSLINMVGVGSSVKISVLLGAGNKKEASRIYTASTLLILILSIVLTVISLIFTEPVIYKVIEDDNLAKLAFDYARVFMWTLPIISPLYIFDNYAMVCGKVNHSMIINVTVSVLNIILNIIFIGVLKLGITFAALSTAISMTIGSLAFIISFIVGDFPLKFTSPKVPLKDMAMVIYNGSSEFFSNITGSVIVIITNAIMLHFAGASGVAAISIIQYIEMLLMPVLAGIIMSSQPIVSFNYGAKNYSRIRETLIWISIIAASISIISVAIMWLAPNALVSVFSTDADTETRKMAYIGLLLYAPSYLFAWFNLVANTFLTAFEKAKHSVILTMLNSMVFPLIFFAILCTMFGAEGIFLSQTLGALATCIIAIRMMKKQCEVLKSSMETQ